MDAKPKADEETTSKPTFDPEERKKRQFFAQYNERAFDEFGRPVRHVVVTDISIPFWSMVGLLIELALAAIPAAIILGLMYSAVKWLLTFLMTLAPVRH